MARTIPADRFHALLEAATAVFLEQGYERTQIADVARRMGLSKGSVYTYVESKEALFHCVLRHADRPDPIALPETLPVPTPRPADTRAVIFERMGLEGDLPCLTAALARERVRDVGTELREILAELYDTLARHRNAIKLLDRCAREYPELAKVWFSVSREGALVQLERYLAARMRRDRLRRLGKPAEVARMVLETLVFWAVHRHWDPAPLHYDEKSSRQTVLDFVAVGLLETG
jgi:AcrR family transcriptional regulator